MSQSSTTTRDDTVTSDWAPPADAEDHDWLSPDFGTNVRIPQAGIAPSEPDGPAHDDAPAAAEAPRPSVAVRIGLVLSTVGLCLLLFVGYVYDFSAFQQHRDQHILLNEFASANRTTILTAKRVAEGQPAGVLTIPAIGITQVIVEGTSATDLLKGPGLMPGTAPPGALGNSVIAGHRTIAGSPFAKLDRLHRGDRIVVVTTQGRYRYQVIGVGTVRPGGQDPTSPSRHPRLTLVTSNPSGQGRLYVVAALRNTPNRLPIPRHRPTPSERGLAGDSAAVVPSVLWGLLLAAALAGTFFAYLRFRSRVWSVYLLTTPILLAILFVWYGDLIRLLQGTM